MSAQTKPALTLIRFGLFSSLFVFPLVFRTDTPDPTLHIRHFLLGIIVLLMLGIFWKHRKAIFTSVPVPIQIAWWVFILSGALGTPFAHSIWEAFFETSRLFIFTGMFYLFSWSFRTNPGLFSFAHKCLIAVTVVIGLIGAAQLLDIGMLFIPGIQFPPYSTMGGTNFLGSAMLILLPMSIAGTIRFPGLWRVVSISGTLLSLWMIIAVKSSAALLGVGFLVLFLAYLSLVFWIDKKYAAENIPRLLKPGFRKIFLLISIVVSGLAAFILLRPTSTVHPDPNQVSKSEVERLILWKHSMDMMLDQPLLGVGAGNWKFRILERGVSSQFRGYATRFFVRAHNDFVQAFAERGILGGLAFLLFVLGSFGYGLRQLDKIDSFDQKVVLGMALSGIICWIVIASFSFPMERIFHFLMLFVFIAAIVQVVPTGNPKSNFVGWLILPVLIFSVSGTVFGFIAMQSEVKSKALFAAKERQDWPEVIRISKEADHWPNEFERHTFTPFSWYLGNASLNIGDARTALSALTRAAELHPWHPQVASNYAVALVQSGSVQKGAEVYEKLLEGFPGFDDARMNLVEIYLALGQKEAARQAIGYWVGNRKSNAISVYLETVEARLLGE